MCCEEQGVYKLYRHIQLKLIIHIYAGSQNWQAQSFELKECISRGI